MELAPGSIPNLRALRPDQLREGMFVFCARPSLLQGASELVGDLFRHVAMIVRAGDDLEVIGFGRQLKVHRRPISWLERYTRVAVAEVFMRPGDAATAAAWASALVDRPTHYAGSSILAAGLLSMARELGRRRPLRPLVWLSAALGGLHAMALQVAHRRRQAFICSTFVLAAAKRAGGPQWLRQPLGLLDAKDAARRHRRAIESVELLLDRWLATPSDLWRAIPDGHRFELVLPGSGPRPGGASGCVAGDAPAPTAYHRQPA